MPGPVRTEITNGIARVTIDNPPVNATSTAVRAGLLEAVAAVQGCDLAVLVCAGRTFIAGGDMSEFDAPPAPPHLPEVVDAIEASATPFLALLHGTVLGGGFEIAMASAFRVARPGTRFGLPEVNVGLIPGAGGTQRAPRLLGWQMSVEMACLGQLKSADEVRAAGGLDAISDDPESLVETFLGTPWSHVSERPAPALPTEMRRSFDAQVARSAKGRKAPGMNLQALLWADEPYATAQPRERALHLELRQSDESRALRHVFFAERAAAKPAALEGAAPRDIAHIGIVGGGLMGSGIAAACLNAGYRVSLTDQTTQAADAARTTVTKLLDGAVDRGKISAKARDERLATLTTSDTVAALADTDLVIEAVFEDLDAKRAVFQAVASAVSPDTLLATNTSYLDPNAIFAGLPHPERCLGLHFFSPAHIMKLVEVIRAAETSAETLSTGFHVATRLRKTPVLAGVCDGFIGNRILAAYRRAAEYLLADGALPHQVDAAMRAFGMAMGPFEAQDAAGLQIAWANRKRQAATRDPGERYVTISDALCEMERFGRRSGAGWYAYPEDAKTAARDPVVEDLIRAHATAQHDFTQVEIQTQLLAAMANEGARIVEDGIAETPATVDVVKVAGYGFPRWRGGPMHWAETAGHDVVKAGLTQLETNSPGSWVRAGVFRDA